MDRLNRFHFHIFDIFIQWQQKVEKGQEDFEKISDSIRKEVARFDKYRVEDFKSGVIKYLETLMENQQKVCINTAKIRIISIYANYFCAFS